MFRGCLSYMTFFFFKQKTAYEMRISDWSSDVCSSDLFAAAGARIFHTLDDVLAAHLDGELMVIGGAELYRQTLPLAQRIYLTEVQARVEDGDAWFTDFDRSAFRETQSESHGADERHAHPFRSEEHTSELQSLMRISYADFCLKKKKQKQTKPTTHT